MNVLFATVAPSGTQGTEGDVRFHCVMVGSEGLFFLAAALFAATLTTAFTAFVLIVFISHVYLLWYRLDNDVMQPFGVQHLLYDQKIYEA